MTKPRLYYFDVAGIAEPSRWCCAIGDIEFEDIRFSREEWVNQYKAKSPSHQAPWLELDDGKVLVQSQAILMYLASLAGLVPSDPMKLAVGVMHLNNLADANAVRRNIYLAPEEKRAEATATHMPAYKEKVAVIEKMVSQHMSASGYVCGDTITFADLAIACGVRLMRDASAPGHIVEFETEFPTLFKVHEKVMEHPKIVEYCKKSAEKQH